METIHSGVNLGDLPADALEGILGNLDVLERLPLLCCSRRLHAFGTSSPTLWRSLHLRVATAQQAASLALWLRRRAALILSLTLELGDFTQTTLQSRVLPWLTVEPVVREPGQHAAELVAALAGGALRTLGLLLNSAVNSLALGAWLPRALPALEELRVAARQVTVAPDFARCSALTRAELDAVCASRTHAGCLPPSLRWLRAGSAGSGFLGGEPEPEVLFIPEAMAFAPGLECLELMSPLYGGRGLERLTGLTRLAFSSYRPDFLAGDLAALRRLRDLEASAVVTGLTKGMLLPLAALTALTSIRLAGLNAWAFDEQGPDPLPGWLLTLPRLKGLALTFHHPPPFMEPPTPAKDPDEGKLSLEALTICLATAAATNSLWQLTSLTSLHLTAYGSDGRAALTPAGAAGLFLAAGRLPRLEELVLELGQHDGERDSSSEDEGNGGWDEEWDGPMPADPAAPPAGGAAAMEAEGAGDGNGGVGEPQPAPAPDPLGDRGGLPDFGLVAVALPPGSRACFPALRLFKLVLLRHAWRRQLLKGSGSDPFGPVGQLGLLQLQGCLGVPQLERVEVWYRDQVLDARVLRA